MDQETVRHGRAHRYGEMSTSSLCRARVHAWHRVSMRISTPSFLPGRPQRGYHALGGGLASWLIHLFIWRAIWRLGWAIWRIPAFGPVIVVLALLGVVALGIFKRGHRWPWRRKGGSYGYGTGTGPRDW